jgi:ketosteroid isomerase-like protein
VSSDAEKNKALVRRFYEAHLKGDLDAMREMMAPDFADRSLFSGEEGSDREAYIRGVAEDLAAFSDIRFTIDDQIAEGNKVVHRKLPAA